LINIRTIPVGETKKVIKEAPWELCSFQSGCM